MQESLGRLQRKSLLGGGGALVLAGLMGLFWREQFYQSYLSSYLFWIGMVLGSLVIVLVQHLTGGRWAYAIQGLCEAAMRTLPLFIVLFAPIILGLHTLYEWADPAHVEHDKILQHKQPYLNTEFFYIRQVVYFAVWLLLGGCLLRWSRLRQDTGELRYADRLVAISGPGIVVFALTMTFASVDWIMSLEPHWYSTIYGAMIMIGQLLGALAFMTAMLISLMHAGPMRELLGKGHFHDLGKMLLGVVMLWAYVSFSQYLIIWSGNLPHETPWYINRTTNGWQIIGVALMLMHFALPFCLLLSRSNKENIDKLQRIAMLIVVMRFVDMIWMVSPAFHPDGLHLHLLDMMLVCGIGGVWFGLFLRQVRLRPILPANDPRGLPAAVHG